MSGHIRVGIRVTHHRLIPRQGYHVLQFPALKCVVTEAHYLLAVRLDPNMSNFTATTTEHIECRYSKPHFP
jgi:hypothetical protein